MRYIAPIVSLVLLASCKPGASGSGMQATASPMEGQFEYVGDLKGQASVANGRFLFLFGGPSDTATMISNAGTYSIANDTAIARVAYSTNKANIGMTFRWTVTGWAGDTGSYVVMNDSGRVTGRGRAVKRRA